MFTVKRILVAVYTIYKLDSNPGVVRNSVDISSETAAEYLRRISEIQKPQDGIVLDHFFTQKNIEDIKSFIADAKYQDATDILGTVMNSQPKSKVGTSVDGASTNKNDSLSEQYKAAMSAATNPTELARIHDSMKEKILAFAQNNESERRKISGIVQAELSRCESLVEANSDDTQARDMATACHNLLQQWDKEFQALDTNKAVATAAVKAKTTVKVSKLDTSRKNLESVRTAFDSRLNLNDALAVLRDNWEKMDKFTKNDAYVPVASPDQGMTKDTELMKALSDAGYVARLQYGSQQNQYTTSELQAFIELRDTLAKNPQLRTDIFANEYVRSVRIGSFDASSTDQLIARLADMSGDKMLTAKNTKEYSSNVLLAGLQSMFGGGKDAQLHIEGELSLYEKMKDFTGGNQEKLIEMLTLRTGRTSQEIKDAMKDEASFTRLVKEFHRGHLTTVGATTRDIGGSFDKNLTTQYKVEQAKAQALATEQIKKAIETGGAKNQLDQTLRNAGVSPDAKTVSDILGSVATKVFEWNPKFFMYMGANAKITKTETEYIERIHTLINNITIEQDSNGVETGRTVNQTDGGTEEKKHTETDTKRKLNPTLVIGFNQEFFSYAGEHAKAYMGGSISAVAGIQGVAFPLGVNLGTDLTLSNSNARLQTSDLKGNFVLGPSISLNKDFKSGQFLPSVSAKMNPNDVKDAIEKQEIRLANDLALIEIQQDGTVNLAKLRAKIKTLESDTSPAFQSEIGVMNKFLADLEDTMKSQAVTELSPTAKKMIFGNDLLAIKSEYVAAVMANARGFKLAGITLSFVPFLHGIFFGFNIQNIQQKAVRTSDKNDIATNLLKAKLDPKVLKIDGNNLVIQKGKGSNVTYSDIGSNVDTATGNITLVPKLGHKLVVTGESFDDVEGVKIHRYEVKEVAVTAPVAPATAPVAPAPQAPDSAETISDVAAMDLLSKANTPAEKLYVLSRTNKAFITAMKAVMEDKYPAAEASLNKDKTLASFVAPLGGMSSDQKAQYLNTILLMTSGSRGTRGLQSVDNNKYQATYSKLQQSFENRLLERAGLQDADRASRARLSLEHRRLATEIKLDGNAKSVSATSLLPGVKDISGMITFSQIDGRGRSTVKGMKDFNGNISIMDKTADIGEPLLQKMLIESAKRSGAFEKNLASTNEYLIKNGITDKLSPDEYSTLLLSGSLPERMSGKIQIPTSSRFVMARAWVPGAACWNDVPLLGFPILQAIKAGTPITAETTSINQSPDVDVANSGDTLRNDGSVTEGVLGLDYSKIVNTAANAVVTETTKIVTRETTNRAPTPVTPTPVPPVVTPVVPVTPTLPPVDPYCPPEDTKPSSTTVTEGGTRPAPNTPPVDPTPVDRGRETAPVVTPTPVVTPVVSPSTTPVTETRNQQSTVVTPVVPTPVTEGRRETTSTPAAQNGNNAGNVTTTTVTETRNQQSPSVPSPQSAPAVQQPTPAQDTTTSPASPPPSTSPAPVDRGRR